MPAQPPELDVLIVYYSRFGVLRLLGEQIAAGATRVKGVTVDYLPVEDQPVEERQPGGSEADMALRRAALVNRLTRADALIVGAPSYFGSLAAPVKRFFEDCATASAPPVTDRSRPWRVHLFRDKVGAAFAGSGTPHGGNELTLHSILTLMMHLGMVVVTPGQGEPLLVNTAAPYGPTAITGPEGRWLPTEPEQEAARAFGERVATMTAWLRWGQSEFETWRAREHWANPP